MPSKLDTSELLSAVRGELQRYVPGIRELSISQSPTVDHALEEWARHLNDLRWWNYPLSRPWPAPIEYEQAFHEASDRSAFVFALRRLLDAIEPILFIPDEDNKLFREENQALSEAKREGMRRYGLRRARIITKRMGRWLQLRQKPADEQFLEALERILLVPDWDDQLKPTGKLTVAYLHTEHDAELHFDFLLTRLRENVPRDSTTLNTFRRRLEQFLDNPLAKLTGAGFDVAPSAYGFKGLRKALIDQFPQYTFVDGVSDNTAEWVGEFAKDFWSRLADTISWRMPWARRALTLLPDITKDPAVNSKQRDLKSEVTTQLSHRQIALLKIYQGDPIENIEEATALAKEYGYTSGEALLKKSNLVRYPTDRIGVDGSQIKPMIKNIEAVIPLLHGSEKKQAESELDTIKANI